MRWNNRTYGLGRLLAVLTFVCLPQPASGAEDKDPLFRDQTAELGLELANTSACWADFNNDSWPDLCAGSVWLNDNGKHFGKLADGIGCAVAADYDNDGFIDLFSWSSMRLFRNIEGQSFKAVDLPELPKCVSRAAAWGDWNGDGLVDIYIGGYEDWNAGITYPDMILINDRNGGFKVGWSEVRYRARGVTACDFDRDGDLDVYVSNYRLQPNLLWLNDGSGSFKDVAAEANAVATSGKFRGGHSIGSAWGDFDNDGLMDLFAGNFAHVDSRGDQPKSRFLRNLGPQQGSVFQDLGACGVYYQESYASPSAADYDNDGDLDLYFTTVYGVASFGKKNFPVLYRNDTQFVFQDATSDAGLSGQPPTYQSAWADYDRDGDLDVTTAGKLFNNRTAGRHWLEVRLRGDGSAVNATAIGTQVRVQLKDRTLTRQVEAGTGEGNQNDTVLHFGLGAHASPVSLEIFWPNGKTVSVADVQIDRLVDYRFGDQP